MKGKGKQPEISQDEKDLKDMEACKDLGTLVDQFGIYDKLMDEYETEFSNAPDPSLLAKLREDEIMLKLRETEFLIPGFQLYRLGRKHKHLTDIVPGLSLLIVEKVNDQNTPLPKESLLKLASTITVKKSALIYLAKGGSYSKFLAAIKSMVDSSKRTDKLELSRSETSLIQMVQSGKTAKEIAPHFGIKPDAIKKRKASLCRKLGVRSLTDYIL